MAVCLTDYVVLVWWAAPTKCSAHLLSCLSNHVRTVSFFSLIGRSDFLNFTANFFVVSLYLLPVRAGGCPFSLLCKSLDKVPFVCFDNFPHFSICCCVLFLCRYFCCLCAAAVDCPLLVFSDLIFLISSAESQSFFCGFLPKAGGDARYSVNKQESLYIGSTATDAATYVRIVQCWTQNKKVRTIVSKLFGEAVALHHAYMHDIEYAGELHRIYGKYRTLLQIIKQRR